MAEFKNWKKRDIQQFCQENFIEDVDWLTNFVVNAGEVHLDMDTSENPEGNLVVIIKGKRG